MESNIVRFAVPFLLGLVGTVLSTYGIRRVALRIGILDRPDDAPERKIHRRPIPLLGGTAIFLTVSLVLWGYALFTDQLFGGYFLQKYLIGLTIGGAILMIGGYLDDRYRLAPRTQVFFPVLAGLTVITAGVGISYITNPFGGTIDLTSISYTFFHIDRIPYSFVLWADMFAFIWLLGMMYTTKFLDGLDGLVSGVVAIGSIVLFFLSISQAVGQPETALVAAVLAGAATGFLVFNFHPARVFLGEGGSVYLGFMLGTLAIISGGKIATALLILGIPILDVAWAILRRILVERRSPVHADRKHLHFRLLDIGFSHRSAVLFLYGITFVFGFSSLFLQGRGKATLLLLLIAIMVLLAATVVRAYRSRNRV